MMGSKKIKIEDGTPALIDFVFSWSLADIMNKDLYRNKVTRIQDTFSSSDHYLRAFTIPLIEETHAALQSSMTTSSSAPACEILDVNTSNEFEPPKDLFYLLTLKVLAKSDNRPGMYDPEVGDLIALTEVRPRCIGDLNGPKMSYVVALVQDMRDEDSDKIPILSSKPLIFKKAAEGKGKTGNKLFAVYLENLTTNTRIWKALHQGEGENKDIINSVLRNPSIEENCTLCSNKIESVHLSNSRELIVSLGLDDSQRAAVLNSIALTECRHQNSVKLIWGPPGTGKTKTIASLVFCLLRMECRTLTCAPTNVAVVGVAKRLMSCLSGELEHNTYGLGDIVLFGNGKRMNIDEHEELEDVFLDHRVSVLARCFAPLSGWEGSLGQMISLLEDPEAQYLRYLEQRKEKVVDSESDDNIDEGGKGKNVEKTEFCVEGRLSGEEDLVENENLKENSETNFIEILVIQNSKNKEKNLQESSKSKCDGDKDYKKKQSEAKNEGKVPLAFEEFFAKKVSVVGKQLALCAEGLYTHMPTSFLRPKVLRDMIKALDLLRTLETFLRNNISNRERLKGALTEKEEIGRAHQKTSLRDIRLECLASLKFLSANFSVPIFSENFQIRNFCLQNACLIFCTVSSSAKLRGLELVIIDEAAQVKECETCIPLQIPGLQHAILVGDENQLPAVVTSKICEKAGFGRSLFERLVILGHSKHLLNVQYRMHPSISSFPNKEFYGNQIRDGQNVKDRAYEKRFLEEKFFGPYSFINITNGREELNDRQSQKNTVEVSVVAEIVSKVYKESVKSKQKVRIGCISPYKAQVFAIQEALGMAYSSDANHAFSVNVCSVDGFQGAEEDIIIISTVRCNGNGSIGFLGNRRRANVALTRARYCLWILGNGATLLNSRSVWQKLVVDAKNRGCFYNAYEDKDLCLAISNALIELGQLNCLFTVDSILFKAARWKVFFSAQFHESITRIQDLEIQKEAVSLLKKLSNGWRRKHEDEAGFLEGASAQLLEWNVVKGPLRLIWTIEILRENSTDTQIIKVLDILPQPRIPELASKLNIRFGKYTSSQMSRCMYKRMEGGLTIPMTWPVDANAGSEYSSSDLDGRLPSQLGAISLRDEPASSTRRNIVESSKYSLRRRFQIWYRKPSGF